MRDKLFKKYSLPIVAVLCAVSLFSCLEVFAVEKKVQVVATLFPEYDIAREIGRDKVDVSLILPPGVEAHAFEPKPRDIIRINSADIFIYTNNLMEPWVDDIIKALSMDVVIVEAGKGSRVVDNDPHIWLDMDNAAVMADNIAEALIEKDPANKNFYADNVGAYKKKLKELDGKIRAVLAGCARKTFIYCGHSAFGYFTRRYGLTQVSPYKGFSPDSEPTPKAMMELVDKIKKDNIKCIYYEEMLSPKMAESVSKDTGAALLQLNAAHNISKKDLDAGTTFIGIMEADLESLKKGLECQ